MMNMLINNNNIVLFDIGYNHYSPDYIKNHQDDFDIYGNHIYVDDDDD